MRAATGGRPYEDNSVDVVGHDDKRVNVGARIKHRQFVPNTLNHLARTIQSHGPIDDLAEKARSGLHAEGDEIRPRPGIVITLQAKGPAMVPIRVKCQDTALPVYPGFPRFTCSLSDTGPQPLRAPLERSS